MLFFGIANGRDCYCAPYYKQMADDDSMCDAVCEGAPTTMCGGKSKSSMFAMHTCASTAKDLGESSGKMDGVATDMMDLQKDIDTIATDMQAAAAALQSKFGKTGDPAASDLLQAAKVYAGELKQAADSAATLNGDVGTLKGTATSMSGEDFTNFAKAKEAETLIDKMDEVTTAATEKIEKLEDLKLEAAGPDLLVNASTGNTVDASEGYYPAMYFVDKSFVNVSSTCGGVVSAKPLAANVTTCAAACDAQVGACV